MENKRMFDLICLYGAALLFSMSIGFSFLGIKTALAKADVYATLAYRFNFALLGALIMYPFMMKNEKNRIKPGVDNKTRGFLAIGVVFYVLCMILQAFGLTMVTSIVSGIIFAISPIITKLLATIFLKERGNFAQNMFIALSVGAVIAMFFFGKDGNIQNSVFGMVLLLIASFMMAMNTVSVRYVRMTYSPYVISLMIALVGSVLCNIMFFAKNIQAGTMNLILEPLTHPSFILATSFLGIPSTLLSALLMAYMLSKMTAVRASMFGNLATAITVVTGVLVLGEPLHAYHIICCILIIVGVAGVSMAGNKPKKPLKA